MKKIQTTLNTYSHLYPNKQAEVAAQLENVMNGTTVPNGSPNGRCSQFVANKREKSLERPQIRLPRDVVSIRILQRLTLFCFRNYSL